jgi:hypothetical protein
MEYMPAHAFLKYIFNLPSCLTLLEVRIHHATVQNRDIQVGGVGKNSFELSHKAGARFIAFQIQLKTRNFAFIRGSRSLFYVPFRSITPRGYAGSNNNAGAESRKVHGSSETNARGGTSDEDCLPVESPGWGQ